MKYEIERRDRLPMRALARLRFTAENPADAKLLRDVEREMDSEFGRGNYVLQVSYIGEFLKRAGNRCWIDLVLEFRVLQDYRGQRRYDEKR